MNLCVCMCVCVCVCVCERNQEETHLDLESIEQSLESWRYVLPYNGSSDDRMVESERERESGLKILEDEKYGQYRARTSQSDLSAQWSIRSSTH